MNLLNLNGKKTLFSIVILGSIFVLSQNILASTIMGMVFDSQRNPLADIDVELLDDYYRPINRTRTSSVGRYEFSGLGDGRFTVRVLAFRYDYKDETALVEISTIVSVPGQVGNGFFTQDFYLTPKKGSLIESELGVVFAQEVPKEAEKLYQNAIKSLSQKKMDQGIAQLRESLKIFPNYYLSLHRLGRELYFKGEYPEAAQVSLKASEINPKSGTSLYYLGNSLSKLNYAKAAIVALNQALVLAPSSYQILFALAKTEIAENMFDKAEIHLLEAKKHTPAGVPDIHWELAQIYGNNLQKYKEAADELELYLKAGKFDANYSGKIKKLISNFREKAKTHIVKNKV